MKARTALAFFALAPASILIAALWPVIAGRETWYLRDLFNYHLMVKTVQADAMRSGFLPLIDPFRAGGQSLVGNLNNVALYPDNLLYLVAPVVWAMNAHLWLHLLLAPIAVYWLGRAWGLAREASWAGGFCYGLSGYFLSQMNLYNLTAGTALAPALAAACIAAVGGRRPALAAAGAGALWGLLLVAGDPILAALALCGAGLAVLHRGDRSGRRLGRLALALALGTLLAAPQLVELARIVGSSYRGSLGLTAESRLVSSWDPRTFVELVVPLFFGRPDLGYWGEIVLGTVRPLFFSLYPGLVAVALLLSSGRPRSRPARFAWSMVLVGGFLALGGWNPLMFVLYRLPQADALRYPIKALLLLAVGASILAGVGFERTVVAGRPRVLLRALAGVALVALVGWLGLTWWNAQAIEALGVRIAPTFPAAFAASEVARWRAALVLSVGAVAAAGALAASSRRAPRLAGSMILIVHVASQIVLLRPLLVTDETAAYRTPSPALAYLDPGERIAHGCPLSFACDLGRPGTYPDLRMSWVERRGWLELFPFAGVQHGLRYVYNTSPEGLDTVLVFAGGRAFRGLDDASALRLLAASAVDVVLIGRAVDPAARELVRLRARLPSIGGELWIYEIREPAEEVRLAVRVRSGDTRRVLREILHPDFDPVRDVFLPGRAAGVETGTGGEAIVRSESWEALHVTTSSRGATLLVSGRAWLPLYRATVDGAPARTLQANMGQLAVAVPAGEHEVEIRVDRRPFHAALAVALAGAVGLVAIALAGGARGHAHGSPCQSPAPVGESAGSAGRRATGSV